MVKDNDYVCSEVENSIFCVLIFLEIEKVLIIDLEMNFVKECVYMGDWNVCNIFVYLYVKNELCFYG